MFTILFLLLALLIFLKLIGFMFKAAFGVGRVVISIVFWAVVILIALIGLAWLVLPILIMIGIVFLVLKLATR